MKFTFPPESKPLDGYTIKRGIHRGGFGEVYYALSEAGKEVALKLLQHNHDVELRGVQQCLNLKHPNLVTIFDIRRDKDGDHWIVMEYVTGRGLDQTLAAHPKGMPSAEVTKWLAGLSAGLAYLHDRGIVHRDLKPANIYAEGDQVKIGDVGLSKFISESRRSAQTQSVGTVYYMAPEVAKGRYGREIDVYALGIILYEMLTGRVPFDGETAGEILMKHLSEKPDLSPIPAALRPVIARALEKDPLKRTSDAAALFAEYQQAMGGKQVAREIPQESFTVRSPEPHLKTTTHQVEVKHASSEKTRQLPPRRHEQSTWRDSEGTVNWMWVALITIVLMAVFAPHTLGGVMRGMFVVGMFGALGYGAYRFVQFFTGSYRVSPVGAAPAPVAAAAAPTASRPPTSSPAAQTVSAPAPPPQVHRTMPPRPSFRRDLTPATLRSISIRDRSMQLTGSMTFAVLSTAVISAGLWFLEFLPDASATGLFGLTTLLASWTVLAASKVWEGGGVDAAVRRLVLCVLGVGVGAGAWWLDQTLLVNWPYGSEGPRDTLVSVVGSKPLYSGTNPTLLGYAIFFAGLFALRRWWWHTDAFRPKQYRVFSALLTLALGYLLTCIFQFPQSWGMLWALAISSVVQLSAVWVPPEQRPRLMEDRNHA